MKKYLQLAAQLVRYGTLRPQGPDFRINRAKSLASLQEFIPPASRERLAAVPSAQATTVVKNLTGQLAFIRAAFRVNGGHLRGSSVAYVRIPKSANTSIGYAMLVSQYPALRDRNVTETQINFLTDVNLHAGITADSEKFFTVVRNPFARLVSVYRDFFETQHESFLYADYLFGILPPHVSFAEFITRISKIPDRLKDQHVKPQHLFLKPYEQAGKTVTVFKLEARDALESFLQANGMELVHRNKRGAAYDYTAYYTPDLVEKVYALYQTDIERFGYGAEYEALKARLAS